MTALEERMLAEIRRLRAALEAVDAIAWGGYGESHAYAQIARAKNVAAAALSEQFDPQEP